LRPSSVVLVGVVKLLVGAYARWVGSAPEPVQRIYFANHTSHIDTMAIWAALPMSIRYRTRPVAAGDYWGSGFKRYLATKALHAVLVDRARQDPTVDALAPLIEALRQGDSLIIFPEGTRGSGPLPAAFKSGLYRLAAQFPTVQLIPVYLENLHRSLPKGAVLPIPMTCTVRFGAAMSLAGGETKEAFLQRAREQIITLAGGGAK
jgi:1-acyl-sn-glycerol-3-phosphate acyltransferase